MGLLTILKKMKQKERELRLLMLYPPSGREGSGGRGGVPLVGGAGRGGAAAVGTHCRWCVTHAALPLLGSGPGRAVPLCGVGGGVQKPVRWSQGQTWTGDSSITERCDAVMMTRTSRSLGLSRAWPPLLPGADSLPFLPGCRPWRFP